MSLAPLSECPKCGGTGYAKPSPTAAEGERPRKSVLIVDDKANRAAMKVAAEIRNVCKDGLDIMAGAQADRGAVQTALPRESHFSVPIGKFTSIAPVTVKSPSGDTVCLRARQNIEQEITAIDFHMQQANAPTPLSAEERFNSETLGEELYIAYANKGLGMSEAKEMARLVCSLPGVAVVRK